MKRPDINGYPIDAQGRTPGYYKDLNEYCDELEKENKQLKEELHRPNKYDIAEVTMWFSVLAVVIYELCFMH